jgi:hypothetical protein
MEKQINKTKYEFLRNRCLHTVYNYIGIVTDNIKIFKFRKVRRYIFKKRNQRRFLLFIERNASINNFFFYMNSKQYNTGRFINLYKHANIYSSNNLFTAAPFIYNSYSVYKQLMAIFQSNKVDNKYAARYTHKSTQFSSISEFVKKFKGRLNSDIRFFYHTIFVYHWYRRGFKLLYGNEIKSYFKKYKYFNMRDSILLYKYYCMFYYYRRSVTLVKLFSDKIKKYLFVYKNIFLHTYLNKQRHYRFEDAFYSVVKQSKPDIKSYFSFNIFKNLLKFHKQVRITAADIDENSQYISLDKYFAM